MNSALRIAEYIIEYHTRKEWVISNLRLQKLLYFIQAFFLSVLDRACFPEDIEAWEYGPVVPVVYYEYKCYGSRNIPFTGRRMVEEISSDDIIHIQGMLDECSTLSTTELVEITHRQEPWATSYIPNQKVVIPKELIRNYFTAERHEEK